MAIGTPFHERTRALCHSYDWRQWSGYLAVSSYNDFVQPEYAAIRNAAALIDISPLYKYEVRGADAEALLNRVVTQDVARLQPGRVSYVPWCDPNGKMRQEGTVFRLGDDRFMVAAAEPTFAWLCRNATGYDVAIDDRSTELAALSLQGPNSRAILDEVTAGAVGDLRFFGYREVAVGSSALGISRTGYTGDLGYELWIDATDALSIWDTLLGAGEPWQITPCGLIAMDIARVEAGFILIGVDYVSAEVALLDEHTLSPYEAGLGWAVKLDKPSFVGRRALAAEQATACGRRVVGLEIDWQPLEEAFLQADLMPELPMTVCRDAVPVYSAEGLQCGRATSRVWSKLLKRYLAIATIDAESSAVGTRVDMEITVNYRRCRVPACVVEPSFFRPERLRA